MKKNANAANSTIKTATPIPIPAFAPPESPELVLFSDTLVAEDDEPADPELDGIVDVEMVDDPDTADAVPDDALAEAEDVVASDDQVVGVSAFSLLYCQVTVFPVFDGTK